MFFSCFFVFSYCFHCCWHDVANAVVAVVTDLVVSVSDAIALCVVIGTADISCVITAKVVIDVAYDTVVTCIAVRCMDC